MVRIAVMLCLAVSALAHGDEAASNGWITFTDELKSGGAAPEMVIVPAGRFRMGCTSGLACRYNTPVREVNISPFAMSVHEVTHGEFRRFVEQTGYVTDAERAPKKLPRLPFPRTITHGCVGVLGMGTMGTWGHTWRAPGYSQTDWHPVVCVSWADAQEYVRWLVAETDRPYRLPSEAEWEYAARAGGPARVQDEEILARIAYCEPVRKGSSNWGDIRKCTGAGYSQAVGGYKPNAFGLHDMEANATEWVEDCWQRNFRGAPKDGSAWAKERCSRHVVRMDGLGNWGAPFEVRSGTRRHRSTAVLGFRVVLPSSY